MKRVILVVMLFYCSTAQAAAKNYDSTRREALEEYLKGHFGQAEMLFRSALFDARTNHDDHAAALSLCGLGAIYQTVGDFGAAEAVYRESLVIFRKNADPNLLVAITLRNLGSTYIGAHKFREALAALRESSRLAETVKSPHEELTGQILNSLGMIDFYQGKNRKAEKHLEPPSKPTPVEGPPWRPASRKHSTSLGRSQEASNLRGEAARARAILTLTVRVQDLQ